jgi:hypothetical protein
MDEYLKLSHIPSVCLSRDEKHFKKTIFSLELLSTIVPESEIISHSPSGALVCDAREYCDTHKHTHWQTYARANMVACFTGAHVSRARSGDGDQCATSEWANTLFSTEHT